MGISEDPDMVHYKHYDVGDNTDNTTGNALNVMTIIPPIADRTYCIPTKYELIDTRYEDINKTLISTTNVVWIHNNATDPLDTQIDIVSS